MEVNDKVDDGFGSFKRSVRVEDDAAGFLRYCIKPARSDWLRGILGRSASRHPSGSVYVIGTAAVREMSQVLICTIPHRRPDSALPASAAHHEGNRSHPGGPVWKSNRS